jgi:predicted acetyltransferase
VFDVRHDLTDSLLKEGGNIAYYIIPSKRKQGFASSGLRLCCKYAYNVLALSEVLVTCKETNIASYKTMKKVMLEQGGYEDSPCIFDDKEEKRVWIKL